MREKTITVNFDLDQLARYTDEYLALLYHVCQANPAEFGDRDACEVAEVVRLEIVHRWIAAAPVSLYHHLGAHPGNKERLNRKVTV